MTITDIHALAVDTDTRLADLHQQRATIHRNIENAEYSLHLIAGHRRSNGVFTEKLWDVDTSAFDEYRLNRWLDDVARIDHLRLKVLELTNDIDAYSAIWVHHRWSRFFLVTNSNGHIHSSTSCHTCHWNTDFRWLPTLSGLTEAEAVAEHGEILCSVCFPSAPVEWTNGESKASKEAKAERAAAKAEREAKRLAKALLPDGSPLVVLISERDWNGRPRVEEITTAAAAKSWLTDAAEWRSVDGKDHPSYPSSAEAVIAEALAAKNGTTAEAEIAAAKQRAAKRR